METGRPMDHMSPLDSMFLHVEDGITHMHIGSCSVFEGPAPGDDEVVSLIASKLSSIPRYRQKVRFVPGGIGRPVGSTTLISTSITMSATRCCRRPDRHRI